MSKFWARRPIINALQIVSAGNLVDWLASLTPEDLGPNVTDVTSSESGGVLTISWVLNDPQPIPNSTQGAVGDVALFNGGFQFMSPVEFEKQFEPAAGAY